MARLFFEKIAVACISILSLLIHNAQAITLPAGYDTIWTTQSENSGGSMPVGGGDIGLNVWAEDGKQSSTSLPRLAYTLLIITIGDILFYIAKSGTFDENNSLLKLGRVRLSMSPNPFATDASSFEQRLLINDGYIVVTGTDNTTVTLWVDVFNPVIHVEVTSSAQLNLTAALETWRTEGHNFTTDEQRELPCYYFITRKEQTEY